MTNPAKWQSSSPPTIDLSTEPKDRLQSCPVCRSPPLPWVVKKYGTETYTIDRCSKCGYAFVNPRPSMTFLKAHYSKSGHGQSLKPRSLESVISLEAADPNSTIDARRMIATIKGLLEGKPTLSRQLLDVGAGYGFFSKEAAENKFKVVAIDIAEDEKQISRVVSGITPLSTTFEDSELDPASMSVVLMSQVLEHALDVEAWVSKAWRLLESGGILAIALPNFGSLQRVILQEKEPYICPPDHLNFFTPGALSKLLRANGFVVDTIQYVSRIPRSTFQKHIPARVAFVAVPLWFLANKVSQVIDFLHFGSIINVYARKASV
jgi:SAM-dependent methyltransferase